MPGTIKDPRMNSRREEDYGIVFMPHDFHIPNPPSTLPSGHYFYYKTANNASGHSNKNNSRYYPHGFPVNVIKKHGNAPEKLTDKNEIAYEKLYCNLNIEISLIVDIGMAPNESLELDYPMASYLHKAISHEAGNSRWGLKNITQGNSYRHDDSGTHIGNLVE